MSKAYRIVRSETEAELVVTVNELTEEGYEPLGGLLIQSSGEGIKFYQSLYRKLETPAAKPAAKITSKKV